MKKTFKKFIPLLVASTFVAGCSMHSYKPGPLNDLVGLYELEVYNKKHDPSDTDVYDYKAEINAKAYFTIDKDGYGFYGYKDKNTKARVDQVFSSFEYDSENKDHPDYIKSVSMNDGVTKKYAWEKAAGCLDESPLGFHDTTVKKYLEYTIPYHKYTWYKPAKIQEYQYVQYKRIADKGGLKEINKLMGTNVSFKRPFEMKSLGRFLIYHCSPNGESPVSKFGIYDYVVIDTETYSGGKMKIFYREHEEGIAKEALVPVTIVEKGHSFSVKIFNKDYSGVIAKEITYGGIQVSGYEYTDADPYRDENFGSYRGQKTTIEEVIQECIDNPEVV